ncbi:MAG TPA: hypothetical protein VND91_10545 [Candidatus Saccharimonadia bacterium]|nr:hypothetical protein [Candidatus Saccharimonadia bacterium]
MTLRNRSRLKLVLVVLVFATPIVAAFALRALGWRPVAERNYGTLVEPAVDYRGHVATAADGVPIAWNSASGTFHVVVPLPPDCGAPCLELVDSLERLWRGLAKRAPRVRMLVVAAPDPLLDAAIARAPHVTRVTLAPDPLPHPAPIAIEAERRAALPAYVIDPNGYLVMRYDAGFDPAGLRRDLMKFVR